MKHVPQDTLAERWTLGAMLLDNAVIDDVAAVIRPEDFYVEEHQTVCRAIFELRNEGKHATTVSLMDLLASLSRDKLRIDMLESLTDSINHSFGATQHAAIIRDKAIKRDMITAFEAMAVKCYEDSQPASELADEAESTVFAVAEREAEGGTIEAVVAIDEAIARSEVRATGHFSGVTTGLVDLDEMLDGMQPGQLIVLAARPSVGKSALAINICEHIALDHHKSVQLFSMEMAAREIGERMICSRGQIDGYKLKTGIDLTPRDRQIMRDVREVIGKHRFGIDDTASRTIGQIAASVRRRIRRNGSVFACIDYLQLIDTASSGKASRQEQVSALSRRLKVLAKQAGIPVMVLSQLNREAEKREDKKPKLADLRESGAIEQDADIVLLLHRPDMHDANDDFKDRSPRKAEIIVAKNRNGPTGTVEVHFYKQWTKFANIDDPAIVRPIVTTRAAGEPDGDDFY